MPPYFLFRSAVALLLGAALLAGCAVDEVRFDEAAWNASHKQSLKRIAVLVDAPDGTTEDVVTLAGQLGRRFVNQKKTFLVLRQAPVPEKGGPPLAETLKGCDGALTLRYDELRVAGDEVAVRLDARLTREGVEVWGGAGSFSEDAANDDLSRLTARYERELGKGVVPYVAPLFIMNRALLVELPNPVLTEDDEFDKIDLDD